MNCNYRSEQKNNYSSNKSSVVSAFFSWKSLVTDLLIKYIGRVKSAWFDRTCYSFIGFRIGYLSIGRTRNRGLIYEYCKVACNNFCYTCHYFVYILKWLITWNKLLPLIFSINKFGKNLRFAEFSLILKIFVLGTLFRIVVLSWLKNKSCA